MSMLQGYLLKQIAENNISKIDGEIMLKELSMQKLKSSEKKEKKSDNIAIIGMAGRFANCDNLNEFWSALVGGKNCISDFPKQRLEDIKELLHNKAYMEFLTSDYFREIDSMACRKGGYFPEIDKFDAAFFGISPREATFMDPFQRIFLETAYQSIEEAGYKKEQIYGSRTGVFVGRDHADIPLYRFCTEPDLMHLTGSYIGILASRLSYLFNLQGPALVIDTACSSALVCVHEACQSIRNGECDMAIAGGINIFYSGNFKELNNPMNLSAVESPDETIRTFDKNAAGSLWGEGAGAIVLKPLEKALADGDHIHGVIRGSAINNDGVSNGITAPNAAAQEQVVLAALKNAAIDPETISYIEAHGTGTILGDPIEIKGLTNAFRKHTTKKQFCAIGSLKPNMGHLVAASGIAALIKVILCLKNEKLPPNIHFNNPNPYIDLVGSPFYINDSLSDWKKESHPRRAGISSFGFSGTNCHLILEEMTATEKAAQPERTMEGQNYFLTLSAKSANALSSLIAAYQKAIPALQRQSLVRICYTSNVGRGHYAHRLVILATSLSELCEKIAAIGNPQTNADQGIFYGHHKVVLESKKDMVFGEITAVEQAAYTKRMQQLVVSFGKVTGAEQWNVAKEIGNLYILGAKVEWDRFYVGQKIIKAELPVYPLDRVRYWAKPKRTNLRSFEMDEAVDGVDIRLDKAQQGDTKIADQSEKESGVGKIELKGKGADEYTQTELSLGQAFGTVLGISELDIYENFYNMGGASILAANLLVEINKLFPNIIEMSDIFIYPTVISMAEYITAKEKNIEDTFK
jgi:polyketide synthase PksN